MIGVGIPKEDLKDLKCQIQSNYYEENGFKDSLQMKEKETINMKE